MSILKNKKILGGLGLIVVIMLGYSVWSSAGSTPPLASDPEGSSSPLSQDLLATLAQLHVIKLDDAVFKDPVFISLSDFGVTIPSQNTGRRNPFAPVGQ
jgi:hypothetical protein